MYTTTCTQLHVHVKVHTSYQYTYSCIYSTHTNKNYLEKFKKKKNYVHV